MAKKKLLIDGSGLSLKDIENFIDNNQKIALTKSAESNILKARKLIDEWVNNDKVIYGVTTGFGEFSNVKISKNKLEELQKNLIISHSAGVGELLPPFIIKIMMLLRVNALAHGHSGIRLETINLLIELINKNIIPAVPSQGSVGSSGDLAPLAHLVLSLLGKGKVQLFTEVTRKTENFTKLVSAKSALRRFNLTPIKLKAKEGLALINGTQMMTSFAAFISIEAKKISKLADISAAISHEALRGTDKAYDLRLHYLRPYDGQIKTAKNMLSLIEDSEIRYSHLDNDDRVQDSYSLRCIPQIHGATKDAIEYVANITEVEVNSVTDNPLIFPRDKDYIEGGNFHGQPIALAMDFMGIALSELANVSERRIERLVNGQLSNLPRFLTKRGGVNSGLMIAQYTAASLVSENKVIAHPASVDSIPTSANQEDHNSMGSIASRKCYQILKNVQTVIAIELICGAQGIEFLKPLKCGKGTRIAYNEIREVVNPLDHDRELHKDIQSVLYILKDNTLLNAVERSVALH
jgi:histidine ammonia-lyase